MHFNSLTIMTGRYFISRILGTLALLAGAATMGADAPETPAPATSGVVVHADIPKSVFVIPASPKDGRNPFFPMSAATAQVAQDRPVSASDFSGIVLNGVTSPPKPSAMINGKTFEVDEEGEIRLSNGIKAMIRCTAINGESATILVAGQRRELRLRSSL